MTDPRDLIPLILGSFEDPRAFHIAEWEDDERRHVRWIPVHELGWLRWLQRSSCADRFDLTLGAVPYAEQGSRLMHGLGSCFWVRTESGESVRRLERFKPRPTLILREGSTNRMVAFWALERGLYAEDIERGNRRLSYALQTAAKHCEPAFRFHPPGTVIRAGRARPVVVHVHDCTEALFPVSMTRRLKDRPKPDPSKFSRRPVAAA